MNSIITLEQKIFSLILTERGYTAFDETVASITRYPDIFEQLSALICEVENKAILVSKTEDLNENATANVAAITDEQQPEAEPKPDIWKLMPFYAFDTTVKNEVAQLALEPLKPGQVPTEHQRSSPVKPTLPPTARILIPNARAGEHFSSLLTVSVDNGQLAKITDVVFPRNIGLYFDKEQQHLSGTPTESGDFEIKVLWSCTSHNSCEIPYLFVVNPDPRSLWKIVEPPIDAPYRKTHLDSLGIVRDGVRLVAASRRGRSHEHAGSFRDDDFYINHSEESGWSIMLVADGAGSAVNSREGSRIAARIAGDYLFSQLSAQRGRELQNQIIAWGPDEQQAIITAMLHHFKQAATLAINSIQNEAIRASQPEKSYSTTLLATVSLRAGDELFASSFWLGDGAIAAYSPSGKVRVLGNPDSGEYAGQTRFLDQSVIADPAFTGRISIGKWNDVSHLILMTDGVSDPRFETDNGLRNNEKWTSLVNELTPILVNVEHAAAGLVEWLNFFSPGNHDDRTIVVSW